MRKYKEKLDIAKYFTATAGPSNVIVIRFLNNEICTSPHELQKILDWYKNETEDSEKPGNSLFECLKGG